MGRHQLLQAAGACNGIVGTAKLAQKTPQPVLLALPGKPGQPTATPDFVVEGCDDAAASGLEPAVVGAGPGRDHPVTVVATPAFYPEPIRISIEIAGSIAMAPEPIAPTGRAVPDLFPEKIFPKG